jgi:hypothetical protein
MTLKQEIKTARDMLGDRIIEGIASTSTFNSHGYALKAAGCFIRLPVPVLWRHQANFHIGEVTAAWKSDRGIEVRCEIFRTRAANEAWHEIKSGNALCFSGAASDLHRSSAMRMQSEKSLFLEWRLKEVSVCFQGANPDCRFWVVRDRGHVVRLSQDPAWYRENGLPVPRHLKKPGVVYLD